MFLTVCVKLAILETVRRLGCTKYVEVVADLLVSVFDNMTIALGAPTSC